MMLLMMDGEFTLKFGLIIGKELGLDEVDYDVIDLSKAIPEMLSSIKKGYIILKGDKDDISRILGED